MELYFPHLFYEDNKNFIPIKTKNVKSEGLFNNIAMAIKIALDMGINKRIISRALPKLTFEGRIQYISSGKSPRVQYIN